MPQLPEYQVETRDIDTFQTRNTGGRAETADFDPFSEKAAESLSNGLDAIANVAERQGAKEDMAWAQSRYAASQVKWLGDIRSYTDPDKAMSDLQSYTTEMMKQAPTGRASDYFVQHMNAFAPRMERRVLLQQAKAETDNNSANMISTINSVVQMGTGQPMDTDPTQPSAPIQPMLPMPGLRTLPGQIDQAAAASKGIVPQPVIDQTVAQAKNKLAVGRVYQKMLEDGPGSVSTYEGVQAAAAPDPLPDAHAHSMAGDFLLANQNNLGAGVVASKMMLHRTEEAIDTGNDPGDALLQKMAVDYGNVNGGAKGKEAVLHAAEFLQATDASRAAVAFKSDILGKPLEDIQPALDKFQADHADQPQALQKATSWANKLFNDIHTSPADYTMNSPTYKQSYDAAYGQLAAYPTDPDVIRHFQSVLQQGVTMQVGTKQVTQDNAGVMPKDTAAKYAAQIMQSPDTASSAKVLHTLADQYGPLWPNALKDMGRQGLNQKFSLIAAYRDSPVEGEMINAFNNEKLNNKQLNMEDPNSADLGKLKKAVSASTQDYFASVGWNPKGAQGGYEMQTAVEALAKQNIILRQMKPEVAAQKAADDLINSQFDKGSIGGRNFLVTKSLVPDGDTEGVIKGAKNLIPLIASQQQGNPNVGAFFGKKPEDVTQDDRDEFHQGLSRYGFWVTSPDGKSLRLSFDAEKAMMDNPRIHSMNTMPGTGIAMPVDGQGKYFDVPLAMLQTWGRNYKPPQPGLGSQVNRPSLPALWKGPGH